MNAATIEDLVQGDVPGMVTERTVFEQTRESPAQAEDNLQGDRQARENCRQEAVRESLPVPGVVAELFAANSLEYPAKRLGPRPGGPLAALPGHADVSQDAILMRWQLLESGDEVRGELLDRHSVSQVGAYRRNIENFVGTVKVPVGIAGPLRVNGRYAQGEYYVPLATSEAALVASYGRGASVITEAGGASAMVVNEGVGRSPVFSFSNLGETARFLHWLLANLEEIRRVAESTTRFGKLVDFQFTVEGNHAFLLFSYTTGNAAGQNMATIATEAAMSWILKNSPVRPRSAYVESNFSGDKKASGRALHAVRGKNVAAEVVLPRELVLRRLHCAPEQLVDCCRLGMMGSVLSGAVGAQGHYANGLAALFIACGQDAACVAEAAVGATRMELAPDGGLYASVTLPNLIVGTVGGGTALPSQQACLRLLRLDGEHPARALAEVAACLCLAGEISLLAAVASSEFTQAHARLARGREMA